MTDYTAQKISWRWRRRMQSSPKATRALQQEEKGVTKKELKAALM